MVTSRLVLDNVTTDMYGHYSCNASNTLGKVQDNDKKRQRKRSIMFNLGPWLKKIGIALKWAFKTISMKNDDDKNNKIYILCYTAQQLSQFNPTLFMFHLKWILL